MKFSSVYFRDEIVRLRDRWGYKDFWRGETPDRALQGLALVYFNLEQPTELDKAWWTTTVQEFTLRRVLVDSHLGDLSAPEPVEVL